jgi:hypothetical protein
MVLQIFESSECHHQQKHVTSTPTPLGLSYMSECIPCKKMRTFSFVREGNRKEDWYSNTLRQIKRKKGKSNKSRRTDDQIDEVAV